MGQKVSSHISLPADPFTASETALLVRAFEDMAGRSSTRMVKAMDKTSFLKLFKLPGLLGERLFAVFDANQNGSVDYAEFMTGLATLLRGATAARVQLMFKMFDMDQTQKVSKGGMRAMLNSILFESSSILDVACLEINPEVERVNDSARVAEINDKVEALLRIAFENDSSSLNLEAFTQWAFSNQGIFEVFEDIFSSNYGLPIIYGHQGPTSAALLSTSSSKSAHPESSKVLETKSGIVPGLEQQAPHFPLKPNSQTAACSLTSPEAANASVRNAPVAANAFGFSFASASSGLAGVSSTNHAHQSPPASNVGNRRLSIAKLKAVVHCAHCNSDFRFHFCFSCGTMLSGDGKPCKVCGESFNFQLLKHCFSCGFDLSLSHNKIEPSLRRVPSYAVSKKPIEISLQGTLFKLGQTFKQLVPRWFEIKDRFLYSFRDRTEVEPISVTFLEGCFVEILPAQSEKLRFGFEIIFSDINETDQFKKVLYTKTKDDCEMWVNAIKAASNVHNIEDFYDIGSEIGTGRFSSVRMGTHKATGKKYAIKILDKTDMDAKEKESLRDEIAILKLVRHPNVIQLKNHFETRKYTFIVMTLCSGGDLFDRLVAKKRFLEPVVKSLIFKVLNVVKYLHDRGIVHRDLKPENIGMVSNERDDDILIGDFGLSKFASPHEIMKLPCGTLAYVAPEVFSTRGYGHKIDMWSVGVITYLLLRGRLPFDSKKKEEILSKIQAGVFSLNDDVWNLISNEAKDFISSCLCLCVDKRVDVNQALLHPFITSYVDPYPELTAKSEQKHQATLNLLAVNHQHELLSQTCCRCLETQSWLSTMWNDFYSNLQGCASVSAATVASDSSGGLKQSPSSVSNFPASSPTSPGMHFSSAMFSHTKQLCSNVIASSKPYFWDQCNICGLNIALPPSLGSAYQSLKPHRGFRLSKSTQSMHAVLDGFHMESAQMPVNLALPTISESKTDDALEPNM